MERAAIVVLERNHEDAQARKTVGKLDRMKCDRRLAAGYLLSDDITSALQIYEEHLQSDRVAGIRDEREIDLESPMGALVAAFTEMAASGLERRRGPLGPVDLTAEVEMMPLSIQSKLRNILHPEGALQHYYTIDGTGITRL